VHVARKVTNRIRKIIAANWSNTPVLPAKVVSMLRTAKKAVKRSMIAICFSVFMSKKLSCCFPTPSGVSLDFHKLIRGLVSFNEKN